MDQRSLPQFLVSAPDAAGNGWYNQWTVEMLIEPLSEHSEELLRALVDLEESGHRGILPAGASFWCVTTA